ncbi:MAG: MoaD/ThiS family protein [Acidilobus sp.]|jgi:molybdopterin synthase sulfur carrier subunit|uniref:MoaD/ThiS family protein n=1 Tax=Acidilobus sp. 7A TaxID=1577685 RepID=UPI000764D9CC|nr:MoaD/ThiS family protein [Acidilobus sp. 7A]AMD30595.1 molybdopterin converting factor, small subunit [Acidilobus sp. 7A]
MGKVKVKYLGYLADLAGTSEAEVEVNGEAKVSEVAPVIKKLRRDDYVLLVDGRGAQPDTPVKPGSIVVLLPETGGG